MRSHQSNRPELISILRRIHEDPEDDFLRETVLADWLTDHGEPDRAKFIRLQCRLARLGPGDCQRDELECRQESLRQQYQQDWLGPLEPLTRSCVFARGLIDRLECNWDRLENQASKASTWEEAWSWVWCLKFQRLDSDLLAPPLSSLLTFVSGLDLRGYDDLSGRPLDAGHVWDLARSPSLANLRVLDLSLNHFGNQGVQNLVESPHLTNLRELYLEYTGINDHAVRALASWAPLANLRMLDLAFNEVSPVGVRALARSPHLANLRVLRLWRAHSGTSGCAPWHGRRI